MGGGTPRLGKEAPLPQVSVRLGTTELRVGQRESRAPWVAHRRCCGILRGPQPRESTWRKPWALVSIHGMNTWERHLAPGPCGLVARDPS